MLITKLQVTVSFVAASLGWRWVYGVFAIISAVCLVIGFFAIPETRFNRPIANLDGRIAITDAYGETRILTYAEATLILPESELQVSHDTSAGPVGKKSFLAELSPFSGISKGGWTNFPRTLLEMAKGLSYPAMLWAALLNIALRLTYATKLTAAPWDWNAKDTSLINIATLPASIIALITGRYNDKIVSYLARRNNNVREPEFHLITMIPALFAVTGGITLYGAAGAYPHHIGVAGYIAGFFFFQYGFVCLLVITTVYVVESYPAKAGPLIVIVCCSRNLIAYGASNGFIPLVEEDNYFFGYGMLAVIQAGIAVFGIPVYLYGKALRRRAGGGIDHWLHLDS
ncbi:hypothetical protein RQP46_007866 [Phenoliferia psychrophenolica]